MLIRLQIWLLVLFAPIVFPRTSELKWVIVDRCQLRISGSTNVNKFGCEVLDYISADTIVILTHKPAPQPLPMSGRLSLDVYRFSCLNDLMTKDLRKTIKATQYPQLNIRFISLTKLPCWRMKEELISGVVDIELAGVTRQYHIVYTFSKDDQELINLTGRQKVRFSDFNLQPPRKLGGMVRAKDQLDVQFCLKLKAIGNNL